jgi:hypothetical protein
MQCGRIGGIETRDNAIGPHGPVLPASLPETIVYGNLVQGKFVFERIGLSSNAYSGVYVIDVNARRSCCHGC